MHGTRVDDRSRKRPLMIAVILALLSASFTLLTPAQVGAAALASPGAWDAWNGISTGVTHEDLVGFNARLEFKTNDAADAEGGFGYSGQNSYCNATLIDPEWVVTAAHCFYRDGWRTERDPANIQIRVGSLDGYGGHVAAVQEVEIHHDWVHSQGEHHDIALLKLSFPAPQTPARMSFERRPVNEHLIARGWSAEGAESGPRQPKVAALPQLLEARTHRCSDGSDPTVHADFLYLCLDRYNTQPQDGHSGMGWFAGDVLVAVHTFVGGAAPLSTLGTLTHDAVGDWISARVPARIIRDTEGVQDTAVPSAGPAAGIKCFAATSSLPERADVMLAASFRSVDDDSAYLRSVTIRNRNPQEHKLDKIAVNGRVMYNAFLDPEVVVPWRGSVTLDFPENNESLFDFAFDGVLQMKTDLTSEGLGTEKCFYPLASDYILSDIGSAPPGIVVGPTHFINLPIFIGGPGATAAGGQFLQPGAITIKNPSRAPVRISGIHVNDRFVAIYPAEQNGCDLSLVSRSPIIPPPPAPIDGEDTRLVLGPGEECNLQLRHNGTMIGERTLEVYSNAFNRYTKVSATVENTRELRMQADGAWVAAGQRVSGYSAGDNIAISANIRTDDLDGQAFVSLNYTQGSEKRNVVARSTAVGGTTGWTHVALNFQLPAGGHSVEPMIVVHGDGAAWVDGFAVANTTTRRNIGANEGFEKATGGQPDFYWQWADNSNYNVDVRAKFVPPRGDVNCDGFVTVVDALFIQQVEVGLRTDASMCPLPSSGAWANLEAGDVNFDGLINAVDALFIMQCEVGMTNQFCPDPG